MSFLTFDEEVDYSGDVCWAKCQSVNTSVYFTDHTEKFFVVVCNRHYLELLVADTDSDQLDRIKAPS